MAKDVMIAGALFEDVPKISVPDGNNVFHPFIDVSDTTAAAADVASGKYFYGADGTLTEGSAVAPSGSQTVTQNGTYDVTALAQMIVSVSGGGGSDRLVLLHEESLGRVQTMSTSATSLGKTITIPNTEYEIFIVQTSLDDWEEANGLISTVQYLIFTANGGTGIKDKTSLTNTGRKTVKKSGTTISETSQNDYGIYAQSPSITSGVVTLSMYKRYNSSYTGTINGNYTTRVYGVNVYALIGG